MSILDISLLVILAGFAINGLFKGIIRLVGHIIGLILGVYLTVNFYLSLYEWSKNWDWIKPWVTTHTNLAKVLAFIVLFVLAVRLIDLAFALIEKIFKFMAVIPGSQYLNNLLGAVLGFLEGSLFLGLIIYVISRYALLHNILGGELVHSQIAPFLLKMVNIILPLLPHALSTLKSII